MDTSDELSLSDNLFDLSIDNDSLFGDFDAIDNHMPDDADDDDYAEDLGTRRRGQGPRQPRHE
jgi:hypothetical protein